MTRSSDPNPPGLLFSAKTARPRLSRILYRERCFDLLDGAKGCQIIYISGPAGQGKTMLALSWLKQTRKPVVYLGLDEQDNHPETLFPVLAEAFAVAFPRSRFDLPPFPTSVPFEPTSFARTFFQSLQSQVSGRYTLVLDDFHAIREEGAGGSVFKILFENLKPGIQVVILSRTMFPAFLSPWLAKRQLFSLDASVLCFSIDEVSALYREVWGKTILHEEAESLYRITEGWVTGLILLQNRPFDKPTFRRGLGGIDPTFSGDRLSDYFCHEVYSRLDPALQTFMIRSSLLDSFSIRSISALISQDSQNVVGERVRYLVRHHLLSEIPASGDILFQYHMLLREFLRDRVKELPEDEQQELVERTARVLQQEGHWDRAVDLYLSHRYFDRAVPLIEKFGMGDIFQGKRQRLLRWAQTIPEKQVSERPWLRFFLGAGREFQQPMEALNDYRMAMEIFQRTGNVEGEIWALSSLAFLCFVLGQDLQMMRKYAVQGRSISEKYKPGCSPASLAFFLFVDGLTACYVEADLSRSLNRLLASATLAHQNGFHSLYINATSHAGIVSAFSGDSRNAPVLFGKAELAISQTKADPFLRAQLLWLRGNVDVHHGNFKESVAELSEAEKICMDYGLITLLDPVQTHLARARLALGDSEAWALLESIHQRVSHAPNRWHEAYIFYIKGLHFLQTGDFSVALAHAEESIRLLKACGCFLSLSYATSLVGVILREMGDLGKAETYLLAVLSDLEKGHQDFYIFGNLLHLSKLYIDCGKKTRAKRYLSRALRMGKGEDFKAAAGLTYQARCILMERAVEWNLEPAYVKMLQAHWKVPPTLPLRIHTLGRFEVLLYGRPIPRGAWHGRKSQDLLLTLLSLGGKEVSKVRICDLLWPEAEGDRAITNFHTTLHRLQHVMGRSKNGKGGVNLIDLSGGVLSINFDHSSSDCRDFEEIVRRARQYGSSVKSEELRRCLERAQDLYQGEYLPGFDESWAESRRQALHQQWLWVKDRLKTFPAS